MGDVRLGEMVVHGGATVIIVFPEKNIAVSLRVQGRDKNISFQQLIHLLFTLGCGTSN